VGTLGLEKVRNENQQERERRVGLRKRAGANTLGRKEGEPKRSYGDRNIKAFVPIIAPPTGG